MDELQGAAVPADLEPREVVRRLRDYLAFMLAGLNEDNAVEALEDAEGWLAAELFTVRVCLESAGVSDGEGTG